MSNGSGRASRECTHAPVGDGRSGSDAKLRRRSEPLFYSARGSIASSDADLPPMSSVRHVPHALRMQGAIVASMVECGDIGFVLRDFGSARGSRWVRSRDFGPRLGGTWVRSRDFGPQAGGEYQGRIDAIIQWNCRGWVRSREFCGDLETRSVACPIEDCEEFVKNGFVRRLPLVTTRDPSIRVFIRA